MPKSIHEIISLHCKGAEAIAYILSKKLSDGNICISAEEYITYLQSLKEEELHPPFIISADLFKKQLENNQWVTNNETELKPFVYLNGNLYLHRYFTYETRIINRIATLNQESLKSNLTEARRAFEDAYYQFPNLFPTKEKQLVEALKENAQLAAAQTSFLYPFSIITGGPGTGKTTTIAKIMILLLSQYPNYRIAMAAPTGKAAARMKESLDSATARMDKIWQETQGALTNEQETILAKVKELKPQTIHKLLGTVTNSVTFRHNAENPLPYELIVIDESSMIDAALMSKLLEAVGRGSRIILLGDRNQLASVEAGSIFGDLCLAKESYLLQDRITELTYSHRFNEELGIGKLSKAILNGEQHTIKEELAKVTSDEITYDFRYSEERFKQYALLYKKFITAEKPEEALKAINEIRFLCATREDVKETNRRIEKILADEKIEGFIPNTEFYENRPIMITRNDYILDLRNGDIGIIRKAKDKNGHESVYAFFESSNPEKPKKIPVGLLPEHETVFAMTIHKSQGSEFTNVAVILPKEGTAEQLLTRELFYTAVTRAKEHVLIQSDQTTFDNCFEKSVNRSSGIGNRLSNFATKKEI